MEAEWGVVKFFFQDYTLSMGNESKSFTHKEQTAIITGAVAVGGSVLGAILWKNHRVLGFFAGGAVGRLLGLLF